MKTNKIMKSKVAFLKTGVLGKPLILALFIATLALNPAFAQRGGRSSGGAVEVKLASPLPRSSAWGVTLDKLAAEWEKTTRGEVRMRVIHDGMEGGESQMLKSVSANNIQAAIFTSFGLTAVCPAVMTLSVPFYIQDNKELDLVLNEVQPILERQVEKTDYFVIAWSRADWVYIFSKDPVFIPDDLRRMKIATNAEAKDLNAAFTEMNFQLVETDLTDVGTKLKAGAISALYQSPAAVAPARLHTDLKNMMDTPIAPFMGGIVINKVTWNRISPQNQNAILRVTRRIASEFDSSMAKTVANAISTMTKSGLVVNRLSASQKNAWRDDVQRSTPKLLGTAFDREVYQKMGEILTKYRAGK
ncbi:MAG: TRAP transporter substrate-binding protein DctP [Treponema sp.]|jgi:TRAP-type C4-dicarboxylate transport system substrate-binding protein|nr:TRAP transporter substrate-binding protein DctP [Treponema sp.]